MKILDRGRRYELTAGNSLVFLQKQRASIVREGTTNEEVLEVLIDRLTEGFQTLPCEESNRALYLLQESLTALRARTARRVASGVDGTLEPHDYMFESIGGLPRRPVTSDTNDYGPN